MCDIKFTTNQSPCKECGKWVKGCRKTCDKWEAFEKQKVQTYENKRIRYDATKCLYKYNRKPKHQAPMALQRGLPKGGDDD